VTRAPDGRKRAALVSQGRILEACRRQMATGNFRPTAKEILRADGVSDRTVRQHFPTLEDLYRAAIDADTAHQIVSQLPLTNERDLALTVVLGRVPA
jgi:AcrR family transcriptional regulator